MATPSLIYCWWWTQFGKKVTRKAYIKISRLEFTGEVNAFYGFAGGQTNQDYCRFQWLTGKESADQIKDMVDVIYTMSNK